MHSPGAKSVFVLQVEELGSTARARLVDDAVVAAEIQAIFDAENGVWGARRITAELNDRKRDNGTTPPAKRINRKRVARLMRAQNLFGFQKKRRVKTTARDKGRRVFADW